MENRKNIVLCSDGTGNTMMKGRGTNVWKLYEAVDLTAHRWHQGSGDWTVLGKEQIAFYDDGVGSQQNKLLKIIGGAFGYGLKRNVRDLYKSLCRAYRPGDDIYIFGFSRGAYTARVLAGLVLSCGILRHDALSTDKKLDDLSKLAYKTFRSHFRLGTTKGRQAYDAHKEVSKAASELKGSGKVATESMQQKINDVKLVAVKADHAAEKASLEAEAKTDAFRRKYSIIDDSHAPDGKVSIRFIGVWDTVAAIGFPIREISKFWNRFIYPFMFPDYLLSSRVDKGCHAISIDDERRTFHPMMWDERGTQESDSGHVEQVWFTGVHSNVGGGYPKQGISLVSLDWMMQRAEEMGLKFVRSERDRYRHLQNVHDKLYDSRNGLAVYYRYRPRNIAKICARLGITPTLHVSALERIALGTQDYAPGNLPDKFKITTTDPKSGAGLENPLKLSQIVIDIGGVSAADNMEHWISFRRSIYVWFNVVTIVIVGLVAWFHAKRINADTSVPEPDTWVFESLDKSMIWVADLIPFGNSLYEYLIRPIFIYPLYAAIALGLLIIFYVTSRFARIKLRNTFAKFWRSKLPRPWW